MVKNKKIMRKSLLLFLALGICTTGHAQVKHVEHNFYFFRFSDEVNPGIYSYVSNKDTQL